MIYDIGFFIFSVFYLPALVFRGRLHREFPERFGRYGPVKDKILLSGKDRIWIQAVSVGEVALCKGLIELIKDRFPGRGIVVSTITKTGNILAKKIFPKDVIIIYFPLDFTAVVKRAIGMIRPRLYIMVETEIWPNLIRELSSKGIPSILVNGRISDRSVNKYRIVKPFLKGILGKINFFCMQDKTAAARIIELGADSGKVSITGNMKFDIEPPANIRSPDIVRQALGLKENQELFVAGSTHEGEEKMLLNAFKRLSGDFPLLKLLIAPRHINRTAEIEGVIKNLGFKPLRVSKLNDERCTMYDVLILDTIGHLSEIYSIAELVFIGGSLVKHGGHNPIEPAIFGRPIIFGPHMFNFQYIANEFLRKAGALQVLGQDELTEKCRALLKSPEARRNLGDSAKKIVSENRGAAEKNIETIANILK